MPWYLKLFLALGGAGLVWKIIGSNIRGSVHSAAGWVLHKFPGFGEFVWANRDRIKPILEDGEKGLEDALDEAPEPPAAPVEEPKP